jgi:hypothetical protein
MIEHSLMRISFYCLALVVGVALLVFDVVRSK